MITNNLISRQEAIESLGEDPEVWNDTDEEIAARNQWQADVEAIKAAPPAEPKKGKWIEQDDGWEGVFYECSVCNEAFTLMEGTPSDNLYNYCPNCGARMEESDDCN